MDGLKTSRVVVLDDAPEDALPLLRALGQAGVGAVYVTGDEDELPEAPLENVRVLFLDMDLGGGRLGEANAMIGRLMGVLSRVIADRSHPLGIVTWTRHRELIDDFTTAFARRFTGLRPVMLAELDKTEDVPRILRELPKRLSDFEAFNFLLFWEQLVSDAAADTTRVLSELVEHDPPQDDLLEVLGALGAAGAGPEIEDGGAEEASLSGVLDALNVVLEDRVARRSQEAVVDRSGMAAVTDAIVARLARRTTPTADRRARLNRMLLVAPVLAAHAPRPGNVYLPEGFPEGEFPIADTDDARFPLDELVRHVCRISQDRKEGPKQLAELKEFCHPLLLELTPDCDYAQKRMRRARLLAGLLLPEAKANKLKDADYVKAIRPVRLTAHEASSVEGDYVLAFDALMWDGLPVDELARRRESWRLRRQQLVDVQAWFGGHAVRPGVVQIDP